MKCIWIVIGSGMIKIGIIEKGTKLQNNISLKEKHSLKEKGYCCIRFVYTQKIFNFEADHLYKESEAISLFLN